MVVQLPLAISKCENAVHYRGLANSMAGRQLDEPIAVLPFTIPKFIIAGGDCMQ